MLNPNPNQARLGALKAQLKSECAAGAKAPRLLGAVILGRLAACLARLKVLGGEGEAGGGEAGGGEAGDDEGGEAEGSGGGQAATAEEEEEEEELDGELHDDDDDDDEEEDDDIAALLKDFLPEEEGDEMD